MVDVMIENVHTSSGKLLLASETLWQYSAQADIFIA